MGKVCLVAAILRRVEEKPLLLEATVNGCEDERPRLLKAPLRFHGGIGSIKIDPPGADERKFRRIRFVGGHPVAAEKPDRRRFGQLRPGFPALACTAALDKQG